MIKYFFALFLLSPIVGYGQTIGDIERTIVKAERDFHALDSLWNDVPTTFSAFGNFGRSWEYDSVWFEIESSLYDYLLRALPHVRNSLDSDFRSGKGIFSYVTSSDRKERIWTFNESVAEAGQFSSFIELRTKNGIKTIDMRDTSELEEGNVGYGCRYDSIYSITSDSGVTYYLTLMTSVGDRRNAVMSIDANVIDGDSLKSNIKLFRTPQKELTSISFDYDPMESSDDKGNFPKMRVDATKRTLFIPVVKNHKITNKNLRYEFDGKQFVFKGVEK